MTKYDITLPQQILPGILEQPNLLSGLIEQTLQQVLEEQVRQHVGAERHERSDERVSYRNGYRERILSTRVGPLTLQIPQTRDGQFAPDIFARFQRSEQAFVLGLMEMVVNGVSTRKVSKITEELCGAAFSKSTVSRLCSALDERVQVFRQRRLDAEYPFILVDALYIKSRQGDCVISRAVLIASAIRADGCREIIGVAVGDPESFATWHGFFHDLKRRGLQGVDLVISDHHLGLVEAIHKCFVGATWQRCQVHFMRNIYGHAPHKERPAVIEAAKRVLNASDIEEARRQRDFFCERFAKIAPKSVACLEAGFDDAMAVIAFPSRYRRRLRSTNMQERLNEEVRRRERVIRIFPNDASALRIIGAFLSEYHEGWSGRRYLDMDEYFEWRSMQSESMAKLGA